MSLQEYESFLTYDDYSTTNYYQISMTGCKCLHDIADSVVTYNIPNKLITNIDQSPSQYVPTENVTMAEKNSEQFAWKGANDEYGITFTLVDSISGEVLPMQVIYKRKTNRSLSTVEFPAGLFLTYNSSVK